MHFLSMQAIHLLSRDNSNLVKTKTHIIYVSIEQESKSDRTSWFLHLNCISHGSLIYLVLAFMALRFWYFLSFNNDSWFLHDISKFINCFSWKIKIISVFRLRVFKKKHVTSAKENLHMHLSMNMKSKKDFLSLFSIDFSQSVSWSWHFMSQMFLRFVKTLE